jgi:hypothetical protein
MNALPEGTHRAPQRSDYEPIVRGLHPFCEGEELTLRTSLLLMRDTAMATKAAACEPAWILLDLIEREASGSALNHKLKVDELKIIRELCVQCAVAAHGFDKLYVPLFPGFDEGGQGGRG